MTPASCAWCRGSRGSISEPDTFPEKCTSLMSMLISRRHDVAAVGKEGRQSTARRNQGGWYRHRTIFPRTSVSWQGQNRNSEASLHPYPLTSHTTNLEDMRVDKSMATRDDEALYVLQPDREYQHHQCDRSSPWSRLTQRGIFVGTCSDGPWGQSPCVRLAWRLDPLAVTASQYSCTTYSIAAVTYQTNNDKKDWTARACLSVLRVCCAHLSLFELGRRKGKPRDLAFRRPRCGSLRPPS